MSTSQPSIIDQIADERDELRDENQRLKQRIELLESANSDVARIAKERDDAILRIKKMVIIGDRLCVFSSNYGYTNNWDLTRNRAIKSWKKARNKESKP